MEYTLPGNVSMEGKNFIENLLETDMNSRPSAVEALNLPYITGIGFAARYEETPVNKEVANEGVLVLPTPSAPQVQTEPERMQQRTNSYPTRTSFELTKELLKKLNVKAGGIYGNLIVDKKKKKTLVHYVAKKGMVDVLEELLQEKCNIEVGADSNELHMVDAKPIHFAVVNGWVESLLLLIEAGADLNAKEGDGWPPLLVAARKGKFDCLKVLIEAGADVNAINKYGWTALHVTCDNGLVDCVKALIEAGADLNAKSKDGWTALHMAARNGKVDCANALIGVGADINAKEYIYGWTALHVASLNGFVDCVKTLIEAGGDLNLQSTSGYTALHLASRDGKVDYVKALIEAGADVKLKNREGKTALDKAIEYNKKECVKYMKSVMK